MQKVKKQLIKRLILSKQVYIIQNHLTRDLVEKISFLAAGRGGNGKIFACLN
jgi:hypothetical protein